MEKYISGSGRFITVLEFFVKQLVRPIPDEAPRRTREKTSATQGRLGHYYQDFVVRKSIYISKWLTFMCSLQSAWSSYFNHPSLSALEW